MYESMYKILLLDQHLPGPIRLVFSDFLLEVRGLKGRKVTEPNF